MKKLIRKKAFEVGFAACGITTADPIDQEAYLNTAISEKRIGAMNWIARDPGKRCDPTTLLPGAKSVICCALSYGEGGIQLKRDTRDTRERRDTQTRRARFARGQDYHEVVREKLEELWDIIKQSTSNAHAKFCVDTSPILEKALAQRAGIGWIGKHTILLNEKLGSWFVLGEIITDLEMEPDEPSKDLCAECYLCVNACPTNALKNARTLDANLCISYITTIDRGVEIPSHIQKFVSEGTYGCDICQAACPYNVNK